ncbi:MAG: hypothetical protein ACYC2R_08430 [Burkholderiales bacterium]
MARTLDQKMRYAQFPYLTTKLLAGIYRQPLKPQTNGESVHLPELPPFRDDQSLAESIPI